MNTRRITSRLLSAIVAISLGTVALSATSAAPAAAQAFTPTSRFVPITPERTVDTRIGLGTAKQKLAAGSSITVKVAGSGHVPTNAVAVTVNVTAAGAEGAGWLQLMPTGQAEIGSSSTINTIAAGTDVPNLSFAPLGTNGSITIYSTFTTDVILDISGYFEPTTVSTSGRFIAVSPQRLYDSRPGVKPAANTKLTLPVTGLAGVPTAGVGAVVLNVTAVDPDTAGWVQVAPTPVSPGASSNLNPAAGQTVAGLAVVPVPATGSIDIYSSTSTDVLVDVVGYFTSATAASSTDGLFVPVAPVRKYDSRSGGAARLKPGSTVSVTADVGTQVAAVTGNVTATSADAGGWVQVAPSPVTVGASSNLNTSTNDSTIANAFVSGTGAGTKLDAYTAKVAHVLIDITGYFTGVSFTPGPPVVPPVIVITKAQAAAQELAALGTTPVAVPVAYDRDDWNHWIDADHDCQNTRAEVLIAEADGPLTFTTAGNCTILTGRWDDPYTGLTFTLASDIDIDHMVPLGEAHRAGGWMWDPAKKEAYANDMLHPETLIAVDDGSNQSKGDQTPDKWMPSNTSYRCEYLINWVTVKFTWALTVTTAERSFISSGLATC